MIILHNPHDKKSREFVEFWDNKYPIIESPECLKDYNISAFPSVVLEYPDHYKSEQTIETETSPLIIPETNIKSYKIVYRFTTHECDPKQFYNEVQEKLKEIEQLLPPKDGVEYI